MRAINYTYLGDYTKRGKGMKCPFFLSTALPMEEERGVILLSSLLQGSSSLTHMAIGLWGPVIPGINFPWWGKGIREQYDLCTFRSLYPTPYWGNSGMQQIFQCVYQWLCKFQIYIIFCVILNIFFLLEKELNNYISSSSIILSYKHSITICFVLGVAFSFCKIS